MTHRLLSAGIAEEQPNEGRHECTDDGTNEEVAEEMESEVHPRIAHEESPPHHHPCKPPSAEEQRYEGDERPGVGSMGRGESVLSALPPHHGMDKGCYPVIVRRSDPIHERSQDFGRNLVAQENEQCKCHGDDQHLTPGAVAHDGIKECGIKGNPHPFVAVEIHEAIDKGAVQAIDGQQDIFVDSFKEVDKSS